MRCSANFQSPPISVLFICSCEHVYHKHELNFLLYLLCQIVNWQYNTNPLDLNWPCAAIIDQDWQLGNCSLYGLLTILPCVFQHYRHDRHHWEHGDICRHSVHDARLPVTRLHRPQQRRIRAARARVPGQRCHCVRKCPWFVIDHVHLYHI